MVVTAGLASNAEVLARGGARGGGGGGRGGGGARTGAGGGMGGGGARPSMGAAHSPSMSRPTGSPTMNRPTAKSSMPQRPGTPAIGGGGSPAGSRVPGNADAGGSRPSLPGQRPGMESKLPSRPEAGGGLPGRPTTGGPTLGGGPAGRPNLGGGSAGRPNADGERANRSDFNRPSAGALNDFLDLPGNTGPGRRPGIATNERPQVGNQIGDKTNIGDKTRFGDVNINAGNSIDTNRQNDFNSIRNKYTNIDQRPFDRDWWGDVPNDGNWRWHSNWNNYPAAWGWGTASWTAFGTWFPWTWNQPYPYDYGTNVVYRDDSVYINDKLYTTAGNYYQQATQIAQSVPEELAPEEVEWMPLGVFAIAKEGGDDTGNMIQLAVSKEAILAGTFYNETAGVSRPIEGMVNQKTQRAAWQFADGKNEGIVMETGVSNLTKDESTALVHFDASTTETWLLVRLAEPEEK